MKKKFIGIVVFGLLIVNAVLPVTGTLKINNIMDKKNINNIGKMESHSINPPEEEWNVTFGGIYSDVGYCVQQTSDGGYIIAGTTNSIGSTTCVWVIKTDKNGIEIWNTSICANHYMLCNYVNQTSDGGYILTGGNSIEGLHRNFWICYLNSTGNVIYQKSWGDTWSESGYCGIEASDGEYIFAGTDRGPGYDNDVWLIKTDTNGNIKWNKVYGHGSYQEIGYSVDETNDGGFIVSGYSDNNPNPDGKYDFWLIKTDILGNKQWDKLFGGLGSQRSFFVQQTDDNGFIQCGIKEDEYGFNDIWLLKTNETGIHEWNRTFGGNGDDEGWCVRQTYDSGFIFTGYTNSTGAGDYDVWLIKINSTGIMEWNITFGGENPDFGHSVWITNDGGYIIAGKTNSSGEGSNDFWLIKLGPEKIPSIPILIFEDIKGGLVGISVVLRNIGNGTAYDINWEMSVSKGFLYYPRTRNGTIDDPLGPGDETIINIKPMMGFGGGEVFFYCKYKMILDSSRTEIDVEVKQEGKDLGFLFTHAFLPRTQPIKEWLEIDSFEYKEIGPDRFVELIYKDITNMHNVRVIDSGSQEIMYQGACCFENGLGTLEEGWLTKSDIEQEIAYWEVELLD